MSRTGEGTQLQALLHWSWILQILTQISFVLFWASLNLVTSCEYDCVLSAYFQFHLQQFARRLTEELLSYSSAAVRVALVQSYPAMTRHIAYNTLSHVYYFNILGKVEVSFVVSTTRCIYTCPVLSRMHHRPPPEVVWAIGFQSVSCGAAFTVNRDTLRC